MRACLAARASTTAAQTSAGFFGTTMLTVAFDAVRGCASASLLPAERKVQVVPLAG